MRHLSFLTSIGFLLLQHHARSQGETCATAFFSLPGAQTSDGPATGGGATQPDATNADWFSFDPDAAGYLTVTSCDDGVVDTRVHIHTGSCGTLALLASNDDGCPLGYPPGNSLVTNVPVTPGNLYFIEFDDRYSNDAFTWELIFHTCPIPVPPTFGVTDVSITVSWDVLSVGSTFTVELGLAGFAQGTGTLITGVTGTDGPPVVFTGLALATDYEVYLTNDCSGDVAPAIGPWPVTTAGNPDVPNDDCFSAYPIACGDTIDDNTDLAFDDVVNGCFTGSTAPGVWYTFTGTGDDVTLSTCDQAAYDTKISVLSGACATLTCVAGNDDGPGCGTTSSVNFPTQSGVEYFILVHGFDGETGDFTLSMTCAPPCAPAVINDECAGASTIAPQPIGACVPVQATNACAYGTPLPNPPCDPYLNIVDVWFTFNTGLNADHTLLITNVTTPVINAAVYLACADPAYVDCFLAIAGPLVLTGLDLNTDYFVRVWNGGGPDAGTFFICDETDLDIGIAEVNGSALRAYPVPAREVLTVDGLPAGTKDLEITDLQGRLLRRIPGMQRSVDIRDLSPGTYLLRASGSGAVTTVRFVKE